MVTLETSKLFNQLPKAELTKLREATRELSFAAGQEIFKLGDPGDGVYVVRDGAVKISAPAGAGEPLGLGEVLPGDVFGEMTLVDHQPRSATATAQAATSVYFVPRESMMDLLRQSPELSMKLVQEISQRLREFNQQHIREVVQAERMALVGRFASSIVHDLKNPLCIIGLAADLMADPEATMDERCTAKKRVAKQVERITNMVNDILEFTRGGTGTQTFALVDYAAFMHSILDDYQPEMLLKSVTVELEQEPPTVKVPLNLKRVSRVFCNLFGNAVDMMPNGGTVKLRFQTNDREITTEVEDTGPGIPPEVADRLFEAFVTFGKPKGTGLGLSIIKKIIEEHGGQIRASNRPGGGAVFAFTLPLAKH